MVGGRDGQGVRQADNRSSNPGLSSNFLHPCYPEEQNDTSMGGAAGEGVGDKGCKEGGGRAGGAGRRMASLPLQKYLLIQFYSLENK